MKFNLRLFLGFFAGILLCGSFQVNAQGNAMIQEILKRMETHKNNLTSLKATVTMDKYNAQLDEHDITEGTSLYVPLKGRDALVRIDWVKPAQEILSVVNKEYVLYRPRLGQAIRGKVGKQKDVKVNNTLSFMNMSKNQLKTNYTVVYLGQETISGGIPTWRLKLTPKATAGYKTAELWVDGNGMPIQAKVTENNNDTTTVLLSNLEKNIKIDMATFRVELPKNTKIIKA